MNLKDLPARKKIVLFDGECNFCNTLINIIITNDNRDIFVFASLQSEVGQQILGLINLTPNPETIVFYDPGIGYAIKSEAGMKIAKELGGIYYFLLVGYLLPLRLRNKLYDYIAKNRYRWYGKRIDCISPTENIKAKFL